MFWEHLVHTHSESLLSWPMKSAHSWPNIMKSTFGKLTYKTPNLYTKSWTCRLNVSHISTVRRWSRGWSSTLDGLLFGKKERNKVSKQEFKRVTMLLIQFGTMWHNRSKTTLLSIFHCQGYFFLFICSSTPTVSLRTRILCLIIARGWTFCNCVLSLPIASVVGLLPTTEWVCSTSEQEMLSMSAPSSYM